MGDEMNQTMESSSVADFYAGKSVFVTGGTGFLGKVIIEKLLYSCPQIDKLYILIRGKRNENVQERFKKFMDTPIFDRIKCESPQQLAKIKPVSGDIVLPNLGISSEDEELMLDKVSVVIHSAATIKFNEPLKVALGVNYEGTKKVLELCRRMRNIKIYVHVSTAYANTVSKVIDEKIYPIPMDFDKVYEKLDSSPNLNESELIGGYPNTYTFTKALSESLVEKNHGDIPAVIVRPSILAPSKSEPIVGWVDSWFGATQLLIGTGKGYTRGIMSRRNNILDLIPIDYVSNFIIVAAAKCRKKDLEVFNTCSSSANPITIGDATDLFIQETVKNGCHVVPFPKMLITPHRLIFWAIIFFTEIVPAYIADFVLKQSGSPPKFIKMQTKISEVRNSLEYFTLNSWVFKNDKVCALAASLSPSDVAQFPCNPSDISWPEYMTVYFAGVMKFLLDGKVKERL